MGARKIDAESMLAVCSGPTMSMPSRAKVCDIPDACTFIICYMYGHRASIPLQAYPKNADCEMHACMHACMHHHSVLNKC